MGVEDELLEACIMAQVTLHGIRANAFCHCLKHQIPHVPHMNELFKQADDLLEAAIDKAFSELAAKQEQTNPLNTIEK